MNKNITRAGAAAWFAGCMSCSEAIFTILNRGSGREMLDEEQGAHLLAGGVLRGGHACGMSWGTALYIGATTRERFDDPAVAAKVALEATKFAVESFSKEIGALDCLALTRSNLETLAGRLAYFFSYKPVQCTYRAVRWSQRAPSTIDSALDGAARAARADCGTANCALLAMKTVCDKLGLDRERDAPLVAGFAGGLGLSGNVCGVLAAAILGFGIERYRGLGKGRDSVWVSFKHESGLDSAFAAPAAEFKRSFKERFGTELCSELCGRRFTTADDLYEHIRNGGCKDVIEFVERLAVNRLGV